MSTLGPCQTYEDQITAARREIQIIQNGPGYIQGADGPHPGRPDPDLLNDVRALLRQISALTKQLDKCVIQNSGGKPDLLASFSGSATITVPSVSSSPAQGSVTGHLLFHKYDRRPVEIHDIALPSTPDVVVSMNNAATGSYDPASGALNLPLSLHFSYFWGPSDMSLILSSQNPGGSALDATGSVTLVDTAAFTGGYLAGDYARVAISVTVTPLP